jgi:hypothetical protein
MPGSLFVLENRIYDEQVIALMLKKQAGLRECELFHLTTLVFCFCVTLEDPNLITNHYFPERLGFPTI